MLQKKVCMLGGFGVGKTSLVRRYVQSIFADTYLTTIGVKIEKKTVNVGDAEVALILWDIAGEDEITAIRTSYLRGTAGYFLVVDVTRAETLDVAKSIQARVTAESRFGSLSCSSSTRRICRKRWDIPEQSLEDLKDAGFAVLRTSAKTGEGVQGKPFQELTKRMVL